MYHRNVLTWVSLAILSLTFLLILSLSLSLVISHTFMFFSLAYSSFTLVAKEVGLGEMTYYNDISLFCPIQRLKHIVSVLNHNDLS